MCVVLYGRVQSRLNAHRGMDLEGISMKSCLLDSSRQQIAWLHQPLIGNALPWLLSCARDSMKMYTGMQL